MYHSFEEKLIWQTRKAIYKHPFLKIPILTYFLIMKSLYRLVFLVASNGKKLSAVLLLMVFYVFSCSFCTPVLNLAGEAILDSSQVHAMANPNPAVSDEIILTKEEAEAEAVDIEGQASAGSNQTYSIEEILENEQELTGETKVDDLSNFKKGDWNLILINKQHPIPEDYEFELGTIIGSFQCDKRVIPDLLEMLKQAQADGISLEICSPYRNMTHQTELFNKKMNRYMKNGYSYMEAYKLSSQAVTVPGASEHQVGLAIDIYTSSHKLLNAAFGETEAGIWLAQHCSEYGFILRYPLGKEEVTGIEYEPWHFRYVGKAAAKIIMEQGITLEEFVEEYDL
ncbi:MAG: D-alanyl-D-alanine carboxypeptidase family protein [Lachnospiraceae bacterium]|jgi:D-alanyl-D-alanine carboxypeptidase|nr:D-alanyl-D-alanine carboxypeptidase family protein [Lachnospiraceae bacterium]